MPPRSDLIPARPRRSLLVIWGLFAALNLAAGLFIASWPERQTDLETIGRWGREWLAGVNIYAIETPDYPPHAIVVFSPIGLLSLGVAVRIWAALNLCLAVLAPYLAARIARPDAGPAAMALPVLMCLSWGGFRTLLQFSLLTLVLGLLAITFADRRRTLSGVALGLALMKPQVALPFLLWTVFTRRWQIAAIALAVPLVGLAIFCLQASANPFDVLERYANILNSYYGNQDLMLVGLAQLRPLVALAVSRTSTVNAISLMAAFVLIVLICDLGFREGATRHGLLLSAPPLAAVWSLLTFYHLTYGFVLLVPVAMLLLFTIDDATRPFRLKVFWTMQAMLMADVPGICRRLAEAPGFERSSGVLAWGDHADRVLMLVLFGSLLVLAVRFRDRTGRNAAAGMNS